jgi:hypothetical protein
MISNERSWPHLRRPDPKNQGSGHPQYPHSHPSWQLHPPVYDDTLKSLEISIERKLFVFALKENARGRFLRITEAGGSKRSCIIIPVPGLAEFSRLVNEMLKASEALPAKEVNSVGNGGSAHVPNGS